MDNCCFALIIVIAVFLMVEFIRRPRKRHDGMANPENALYGKKTQLSFLWRDLFDEHVDRVRLYIVSVLGDLPDQKVAEQYLLANADDLGRAMGVYYGDAVGNQFTALMKEHIAGGGKLIHAVHEGKMREVPALNAAWKVNAGRIAAFLASLNPAWPVSAGRTMMYNHLALESAQLEARSQGRYTDDVAAFSKAIHEILMMADWISGGIIRMFPSRFS